MGVVSPERPPSAPERAPAPPPPEPPRPRREPPRFPFGLVALGLAIVAALFLADRVRDFLPSFDNPFASETIDRSPPPVLKAIRDLGEYRAASGDYQVIVDLHKDTQLPDELLGERTLFVAVGSVDAGVDLSAVDEKAVDVSDDRRSVTLTLPHARLYEPELDSERSQIFERDEGLFTRIGSFFGDDPNYQQELNVLAEQKLTEAAQTGSGLVPHAEENTRAMLESLLGSLGFSGVEVRFE